MGFERDLSAVAPVLLTADGGLNGQLQLTSTLGIFVKQEIVIQAASLPALNLQVKRVLSDTQILVGPPSPNMNHFVDVSAYTVALGSFVFANIQPKSTLPMESRLYGSYIQEPSNSWRVTPVDSFGNSIDSTNPLPIVFDGSISIGEVGIVGPAPDKNQLEVNSDGSINVNVSSSPGSSPENITTVYNEVSAVPPSTSTSLVTYTVPIGMTAYLQRALVSGENIARYDVYIQSSVIATKRTYYGSDLNCQFPFNTSGPQGLLLSAGNVVTIKVLQTGSGSVTFDGTLELIVNPNVVLGSSVVVTYSEVIGVPSGLTETIGTYVVPNGDTATLQRIMVSGENIGRYDVLVNGIKIATKRTYFGGELNQNFDFTGADGGGVALNSGDTITVTVLQNRLSSATYESTIEVILVT